MITITEEEYTNVVRGFSDMITIEARCRHEIEEKLDRMTKIKDINSRIIDNHQAEINTLRQQLDTTNQQKIELNERLNMLVERNDIQRTNIEQLQAEVGKLKDENICLREQFALDAEHKQFDAVAIDSLKREIKDKDKSIATLTEKLHKRKQ
jgi:chromosome segregation ATPase